MNWSPMTAKSRKRYDQILCVPMEIYNTIYESSYKYKNQTVCSYGCDYNY